MTDHQNGTPSAQRLQIVETESQRLLRNASAVDAAFVALTSRASLWHVPGEDDVVTTSAPCVAVRDLPAGHDVVLEAVDPFEGGHLAFTLVRAEWADGRIDLGLRGDPPRKLPRAPEIETDGRSWLTTLSEALLAGRPAPERPVPPPRVEREVLRLGTAPGSVSRGLLDPARGRPAALGRPAPTCMTCRHSLRAIALGLGVRCTHPAHNPHHEEGRMDYWMIPGRWYRCPVHEPRPTSDPATSHG